MRVFRKYIMGIDPQDEETPWDSVIPAKTGIQANSAEIQPGFPRARE